LSVEKKINYLLTYLLTDLRIADQASSVPDAECKLGLT